MYDILIKNGLIVDGRRTKGYVGDVAILNGEIELIGKDLGTEAVKVIDAKGKVVAPGFIDLHTHSDTSFIEDSRSESKILQGVTTEVVGNCGSSFYPAFPEKLQNLRKYLTSETGIDTDYYASVSFLEFIDKAEFQGHRPANNWATLIGHNALRTAVMGEAGRHATQEEIWEMADLLEQEMASGAWGLSLGLGYSPGIFSDINELEALAEVVARYDGIIASHMRDQGDNIFKALDEMFELNRRTGAHVHIAHLKRGGKRNWGRADELLNYIRNAQHYGVDVTCDIYPYEASSSGITNTIPKWALAGGVEAAAERFRGPERERLLKELSETYGTIEDGHRIYVVSTGGRYPEADDKTIGELALELNITPMEAIAKVITETNGHARQISFGMLEEDMLYLIKEVDISIGSDGSGFPLDPALNAGKPHPRNFGTFPRALRLAREHKLMSLEDAVYKMTGNTATILGMEDRGFLEEGLAADIVIFDAEKVTDKATYRDPFQKPEGIEWVIVNGEIAVENGKQTDARTGEFLLK